ncbi:MAG: 50S ribosomal protein L1 [Rickettsiales bacterium]|jgi:large subunit ribosomal protein L1|nr:50S ribosomal protein L1 [Rickettsiales bacterium]
MTKTTKVKHLEEGKGGKNIRQKRALVDSAKQYSIGEAVTFLKTNSFTKFDSSIEVICNLGVDTKHSDQQVRGVVSMPHGTGKEVRVAVFAKEAKAEEAQKAGADIVGSDDLLQSIQSGKIDFDCCIATPDMMGFVGRVAKVLGPKGLMPNPKLGTVTVNVAEAVTKAKAGQVEFRAEKAGIVHAAVGKLSFEESHLLDNVKELLSAVIKAKPSASKGTYLKSLYISSSMGPSLPIDVANLSINN